MVGLRKRAFTLIELLVVIAIIAILAAILFPVFAQARGAARQASCISNTKQFSLGILMYSQDFDETIPRLFNSGSSQYGWCPQGNCGPGWGTPGSDPNAKSGMFAAVVQPYVKNLQVGYCPEAGTTNWKSAIPALAGVPYIAALETNGVYYASFAQMAVNIDLVEWNPSASWSYPNPPSGPIGAIASWARPAETILITGDSVWGDGTGGDPSPSLAVGNTGVWPSRAGAVCTNQGNPGWTWYLHKATSRSGSVTGTDGQDSHGINSGFATIAMCDGHVKAVRHNELDRCDYNTSVNAWVWTHWDPRY